jgi:hypothetical protein
MIEKTDGVRNDIVKKTPRTLTRKILYTAAGAIMLIAIAGGIVLTTYPNTIIHYVVEPKLKQLVVDRLGRRYALQMKSITLSENKDSLILTGVRIVDNGMTDDGSSDTSVQNFGVATPLDRLTTDTVMIAGLDYWKLIFQRGLFAGTITIRSPKIYLRPGTLPKFAQNTDILPSFLPAVSSKIIKVENAEVYLTEGTPWGKNQRSEKNASLPNGGGVLVKKASLEFHDFYLDESAYKKTTSTFFCKSATFHAEDVSHIDSLGVTDIHVTTVDGNLIDSSMEVFRIESKTPIEEVSRVFINKIEFTGLDWYTALAGHGLHGRKVSINSPQIYLQDVADIRPKPLQHYAAADLIPLPTLLPDVSLEEVEIVNAEMYALLPKTDDVSSLKRIKMSLNHFKLDHTTPFTNVSSFFSQSAQYGIKDESTISTSMGMLHIGEVTGTEKSLNASNIRLNPSWKGLKLVRVKSVEISGVDIWKLLMRDGLFASSVNIRRPNVNLEENLTLPITSIDSVLSSDPLALIRGVNQYPLPLLLPVATIGTITVSGGSVHGIHFLDDPKNLPGDGDSISGLNISLKNFKLDHNSWISNRGMLFSRSGTFSIGALTQLTPGAIYSFAEGGIKGDLRKHTLTIRSVAMHPLISEDSFGAAFKYRTERIDFSAPVIDIAGVDYQKLFLGNGLFADSIYFSNWNMNVYGDRRRPEEPRVKSDKFPHQLFQQIKMPVGINRTVVRDGAITFRESWPDTTTPGTVILNHVNVHIGEVSNKHNNNNDTIFTPIEGSMKIMNSGLINFTIGYQFLNPHLTLDVRGNVGSMDASLFNEYLAKTEPFTLTGIVRSADFSINLRDSLMTGTLTPQYDSLHVKFFRWDKFPPGLVSFLANAIFMRSHNIPELDKPLHSAEISAILPQDVSLFWALWKPIRNGIGSIVRIPEWVW